MFKQIFSAVALTVVASTSFAGAIEMGEYKHKSTTLTFEHVVPEVCGMKMTKNTGILFMSSQNKPVEDYARVEVFGNVGNSNNLHIETTDASMLQKTEVKYSVVGERDNTIIYGEGDFTTLPKDSVSIEAIFTGDVTKLNAGMSAGDIVTAEATVTLTCGE